MTDVATVIAVISTLISSVALVGVAVGLILQANQLRLSRAQAFLSSQAELVRLAMEYPDLTPKFFDSESEPSVTQQYVMLNWQVRHNQFGYLIGELPEQSIRSGMLYLFASEIGRQWWTLARPAYLTMARTRRGRRFIAIVDDACTTRDKASSATVQQAN